MDAHLMTRSYSNGLSLRGLIDVKLVIDVPFPKDVMVLLLPIFLTMLADAILLFVVIYFGCVNDVVLLLQLFLTPPATSEIPTQALACMQLTVSMPFMTLLSVTALALHAVIFTILV